jgi:hypothetical protein
MAFLGPSGNRRACDRLMGAVGPTRFFGSTLQNYLPSLRLEKKTIRGQGTLGICTARSVFGEGIERHFLRTARFDFLQPQPGQWIRSPKIALLPRLGIYTGHERLQLVLLMLSCSTIF